MKPFSEKLKELERARDAEEFSSSARAAYAVCIDLLQAWLREADSEMVEEQKVYGLVAAKWFCSDIRQKLLGTTRTEGEK